MSADTLTADAGPVTIAPPPPETSDTRYTQTGFAVMSGNPDEIVIVSGDGSANANAVQISGYDLSGNLLFRDTAWGNAGPAADPEVATDPGRGVVVSWYEVAGGMQGEPETSRVLYTTIGADGSMSGGGYAADGDNQARSLQTFSTADGFAVEWQDTPASAPNSNEEYTQLDRYHPDGTVISNNDLGATGPFIWTDIALAGGEFSIYDNTGSWVDGATHSTFQVPGEPAHAMTQVVAASLADGHSAAVAWVDSGTDYVSIYDSATNSFTPAFTLDWGGASDVHVVALNDGGYAVSWMNGGAYYGGLFDAAGNYGGKLSLTGDFAAINSHGDLYTVGKDANGNEVVQTYAISGSNAPPPSTVYTSDANYTAADGVTTIYLTGQNQTIHANNGGDVIFSDNTQNVLYGGAGNDTFHIGRAGDTVTGGGGTDTFVYADVPWGGSTITDFHAGDTIDMTGLVASMHDPGSDPFADGYLKYAMDASGNAQIWADYNQSNNNGWWLVATLDGVSTSSLHYSGGLITESSSSSPSSAVSTSDANYTAPAWVNSITLTGSNQTVTANNAQDTTIWSDNTSNTLNGGTGDDTFHIGRAGDTVTGGAGRDVFVFDDIPWGAATINGYFADQGDSIDVSGILAHAHYTGSDPIGDGYLKISGNQIFADYNQPGNNAWWLVANVYGPDAGALQYAGNGLIDKVGEHVGGTVTTSGSGVSTAGYDTIIMTGSNGVVAANDGGDTLIDQGANNQMYGGRGNDTFVLGTSTTTANDTGGGINTWVMNPQSTVVTHENQDGLIPGDRIDVRSLLAASHYTGSDPVGDGYVFITPPPYNPGGGYQPVASQLMYDPDGAAGPQAARPLFDTYYATPSQFHYADGFFVVQ